MISKVLWQIFSFLLYFFKHVNRCYGKCGLPESTANGAESLSFGVNATVHFSPAFSTSEMWASVNVPLLLQSRIPQKDIKMLKFKKKKPQKTHKAFCFNTNVKFSFLV